MKVYILILNVYAYDYYITETKFVTVNKDKMKEYVTNLDDTYFSDKRDYLNLEIWQNEINIVDAILKTKETFEQF